MFPTSIAGSLPKPSWLAEPNRLWAPWRLAGTELDAAKRDATLLAIKLQEDAGIDIVTDKPHVFAERTEADEVDKILKPGMIIMAEPNPITADGLFGIFLGHTLIVTKDGHECVDNFPLEIAVAQC